MKKALTLLVSLFALTGCHFEVTTTVEYDDADKYDFGSKTFDATASNLDIGFIAGDLTISSGDSLSISEVGEHEELTAVHHWLNGDVLYIHDTGAGKLENKTYEKDVTLTVPNSLETAKYDLVSGTIISSVDVKDIEIDAVYGNLVVTSTTLESLTATLLSADIDLYIPSGKTLDVTFEKVSGKITGDYTAGDDIKINVDTISGNLNIHTIAE